MHPEVGLGDSVRSCNCKHRYAEVGLAYAGKGRQRLGYAELEFLKSLWGLGTEEESYRPARLVEFIPWNRFLSSINV
jgi:hypothetical protein